MADTTTGTPNARAAALPRTPRLIHITDVGNHTADVCKHTSAGLDMLLYMLDTSELEPFIKDSFTGLLRPMVGELQRAGLALRECLE